MKKNLVIILLSSALVAIALIQQKRLYEYSVEIAEAKCGQAVASLYDFKEMPFGKVCELVRHDIFMTLEVMKGPGRQMQCEQTYGFWGPSQPENCQFVPLEATQPPENL